MPDPDQVIQRLKHTVVKTPGILHTWKNGTIFSNKTTENWRTILNIKPAHMALHWGTHSLRSMSQTCTIKLIHLNERLYAKLQLILRVPREGIFLIESTFSQDGPPPRALHVPKVSQGTKSVYSQLSTGIIHTYKPYVEKAQL